MIDFNNQTTPAAPAEKQKLGKMALDFLIGIFQPLVPAIAGAGVLKSILILLVALHVMDDANALYKILAAISDATFYFLPMMVAVTTANKLKSNRLVAIAAVGVTLLPAVTTMIAEGTTLFGIQLQSIAYNAQVFPANSVCQLPGVHGTAHEQDFAEADPDLLCSDDRTGRHRAGHAVVLRSVRLQCRPDLHRGDPVLI